MCRHTHTETHRETLMHSMHFDSGLGTYNAASLSVKLSEEEGFNIPPPEHVCIFLEQQLIPKKCFIWVTSSDVTVSPFDGELNLYLSKGRSDKGFISFYWCLISHACHTLSILVI